MNDNAPFAKLDSLTKMLSSITCRPISQESLGPNTSGSTDQHVSKGSGPNGVSIATPGFENDWHIKELWGMVAENEK